MESPNFQTRPRMTAFRSTPTERLFRIDDFTRERGGRNRQWSGQINLRLHAALAALEVACRRRDAYLAIRQEPHFGLADAAAGRDDLRTRFEETLDQPVFHAAQIYLLRCRRNEETHAFC